MSSGHLADFVHFTTIGGEVSKEVASNFGKRGPAAPPCGRNGGPVVAGGRHHHPTAAALRRRRRRSGGAPAAAAAVGRKKKKNFFFFFPVPFGRGPIKKDAG
ncbi:hypothetical protein ABFX02_01G114401 [Erythranthe guttata]